jgi:hypothetical protein
LYFDLGEGRGFVVICLLYRLMGFGVFVSFPFEVLLAEGGGGAGGGGTGGFFFFDDFFTRVVAG